MSIAVVHEFSRKCQRQPCVFSGTGWNGTSLCHYMSISMTSKGQPVLRKGSTRVSYHLMYTIPSRSLDLGYLEKETINYLCGYILKLEN